MFSVLIDTNVWSELVRPRPNERVHAWMHEHFERAVMSAIVLGEIRYGIALASGEGRRRFEAFHDALLIRLPDGVASFDAAAAAAWGELRARLKRSGQLIGERDMLIAGHALSLGLPVVTRNVSEMERTGVDIINPWQP